MCKKLSKDLIEIIEQLHVGMIIKKPTKETEIVKKDDGGIYYKIGTSNMKKVTYKEIELAYTQLEENGFIERAWFNKKFEKISKTSPCNFTTIGGVFLTLGLVRYERGKYFL
jgi:hypothetical protein